MNMCATPRRWRRRVWFAVCLVFGLVLPTHADNWVVKSVPDPQGGRSHCMLESPRQVIDDGYTKTAVQVRADAHMILVVTESDIDLSFGDVGLRVDDSGLMRPDTVHAQQDLVFLKDAARHIESLCQDGTLYVDLRFWPTWPSRGRRTVRFVLDGFSQALARLPAGC
jgi:hypothetical protein